VIQYVADVVEKHVCECRKLKALSNATAIIIPESNLPFAAVQLQRELKEKRLENHIFILDDSGRKRGNAGNYVYKDLPGSITTHAKKIEMVQLLIREYLQPGRICYHDPFIVTMEEDSAIVDFVQLEVTRQLRGFKQKRRYRTDGEDTVRCQIVYTGKEPVGTNDDFVMALLLAVYHERDFRTDQRFIKQLENARRH
jgi:hypothetical protein